MVTTIIAFGPYYTACHISALKGGELDVPTSDNRYIGDMEFCCKWQQDMRKVGLEITDDQIQCLHMGVNPKDTSTESTINISADSPIGTVIASWESHVRVKPGTGGSIPTTITQLNNDPNISGLDVGTYAAGQTAATTLGGSNIVPNLVFPDVPPLFASTHLHGRYHMT